MADDEGSSVFYYFYCIIDFVFRRCWEVTLAVVLGLYVYLAVEILRESTKKSPVVLDLIHWRDPRKSSIVFGLTVLLLLSFSYFNSVTLIAYLGLAVLAGTLGYRSFTAAQAKVNKTEQKNPFKAFLDKPLNLPHQDRAHDHVDVILKNVKELINHLRSLFLIEDIGESVKFGLFLWSLTYVGEYVSGATLIMLAVIGLFTLPKIYEMYQPQIDNYYNQAKTHVKPAVDTAKKQLDKIPVLGKKAVKAE